MKRVLFMWNKHNVTASINYLFSMNRQESQLHYVTVTELSHQITSADK